MPKFEEVANRWIGQGACLRRYVGQLGLHFWRVKMSLATRERQEESKSTFWTASSSFWVVNTEEKIVKVFIAKFV